VVGDVAGKPLERCSTVSSSATYFYLSVVMTCNPFNLATQIFFSMNPISMIKVKTIDASCMPKHFANEFPHDEARVVFFFLLLVCFSSHRPFHQGCKKIFFSAKTRLNVTIERLHFHIQSSSKKTNTGSGECASFYASACKMVEWIMMVAFDASREKMLEVKKHISNAHFFLHSSIDVANSFKAIRARKIN
jgi:hypothetical protein